MHDLWLAVTTGQPRLALPAFFPEAAYAQVKAIADPQSDWQYRLWYDFTLDVAAAHALLGHGATLVRVIAPTEYAAWVYPGACYNSTGYWHLPGARVVYRQGSQLRSFGIASLFPGAGTGTSSTSAPCCAAADMAKWTSRTAASPGRPAAAQTRSVRYGPVRDGQGQAPAA